MLAYIVKRIGYSIFALFAVSAITFFAVFASGDPAVLLLPPEAQNPEEIARFRENMGLDRPLPVQYVQFIGRAVQGDFGRSLKYNVPAATLVRERLPATIVLAIAAVIVSAAIGIPLGVLAAVKKGSPLDDAVIVLSALGLAAPSFWIGTMLIVFFAVQLRVLPPSGGGSLDKLVLPTITLAAGFVAVLARFTRSGMLDVLSKEYVTTAHAKGLPGGAVLFRHALRNTMIPIVTLLGLEMGTLLGGAVVTENVFAWPGIGQLVVMSVFNRDYPLVVACVLTAAALFILVNLLVDILYVYINPTVRL
jgi:ABC-type dipeptide/oligopeptide/nickel transport system permease component